MRPEEGDELAGRSRRMTDRVDGAGCHGPRLAANGMEVRCPVASDTRNRIGSGYQVMLVGVVVFVQGLLFP